MNFATFVLNYLAEHGGKALLTDLAAAWGKPVDFQRIQRMKKAGQLSYVAVIVDNKPNVEVRA